MMKFILTLLMALSVLPTRAQTGAHALYDYGAVSYMVRYRERDVRSIASITKLFTANTVLQSRVDLEEKIKVNGKSSGRVPSGVYMSRFDLMRAMIISSDNRAAETLANHHPGGFNQFVKDVNSYLDSHALYDTRIVDSTGLLPGNTSTAKDLIEFLYQIKDNPTIRKIANERNAVLNAPKGKKTIQINLRNTNPDLFVYDNILISKTGFTSPAGRCVLMLLEKNKELYAVVVLGQPNPKVRSRVVSELLSVEVEPRLMTRINSTIEFEFFTLK
jgi:D-alanyl-D-alanine endopeptidase (penicillin-binding protein 7)